MSNENTNVTSNKKKWGNNDYGDRPVSTLKKTRDEAKSTKSTKSTQVKWSGKSIDDRNQSSKAQVKMEKILKPIENMLASLHKPLVSQFKSFLCIYIDALSFAS